MAKKIKGITIEIGADTKQFTKAIADAEKQIGDAAYKMRDINKLLKADPKNVELLTQKQKTFTEAIKATKEKLKEEETRAFVAGAFRDGGIKTTGTDIDRILPAVSRFGSKSGNRKAKKETVIEKLKAFFERFWNIG